VSMYSYAYRKKASGKNARSTREKAHNRLRHLTQIRCSQPLHTIVAAAAINTEARTTTSNHCTLSRIAIAVIVAIAIAAIVTVAVVAVAITVTDAVTVTIAITVTTAVVVAHWTFRLHRVNVQSKPTPLST
jgi:hypothetical protein